MKRTLTFVTGNKHKVSEAQQILDEYEIIDTKIDLPEIQGIAEEIIREKVKFAFNQLKKEVFVEDTSLCFNALHGLPGPYISTFLKTIGNKNVVRLLDGFDDKSAKAVCMIGYSLPGKEPVIFEGVVEGRIVNPRGGGNFAFGWDPIFLPEGHDKTFSEMTAEEKNSISHRKRALEKFRDWLENSK